MELQYARPNLSTASLEEKYSGSNAMAAVVSVVVSMSTISKVRSEMPLLTEKPRTPAAAALALSIIVWRRGHDPMPVT